MIVPTVHSNGSGRDLLFNNLAAAVHALNVALEALAACGPHGRDYYPQGEKVIFAACDEHVIRCDKIEAVRDELTAIAAAVDSQA